MKSCTENTFKYSCFSYDIGYKYALYKKLNMNIYSDEINY